MSQEDMTVQTLELHGISSCAEAWEYCPSVHFLKFLSIPIFMVNRTTNLFLKLDTFR